MVRELYIDNQRVDLPDDVRFQLTFEIADFGELKPRGSGSNTIKLPKTPRNTAIFDNCNFVQVNSKFPYVVHSAYYYEDGWLIFSDATVYMLAITQTDFEIQCVWGNSNTIRELKALDMGDVAGLGGVNFSADAYGMIDSGYSLSDKGLLAYRTRGLLSVEKTLGILGINIDKQSDLYTNCIKDLYVFPNVNSVKGVMSLQKNGTFNGTVKNTLGNPYYLWISGAASFYRTEIKMEDTWNNRDVYLIPIFSDIGYRVYVTIHVEETDIKNGIISVLYYTMNGSIQSVHTKEVNINGSGRLFTNFYFTSAKTAKALMVSLFPKDNITENQIFLKYTCEVSVFANPVSGENFDAEITMPTINGNNPAGFPVLFSDVMRGVKAYDFAKSCFENFGVIIENLNNNIEAYTYDDIANNTENIKDWSDKLVYIKEEVLNNEFGSKNNVKYKQSQLYNGYGDGFFENELAKKREKGEKNIVENSLFSFNNGGYDTIFGPGDNHYRATRIPMYTMNEDNEIEFSGDGGFWLVKLGDVLEDYPLVNSDYDVIMNAQVRNTTRIQPTFSEIRPYVWKEYISIQNEYRKVKAIFNLSARDIADFSFKRPVYLRQYAQLYVVTKIDYNRSGSIVEMILIR